AGRTHAEIRLAAGVPGSAPHCPPGVPPGGRGGGGPGPGRAPPGTAWDDPVLHDHVGRLEAQVEGLWRMTQRGVAEAEETGMASPTGSAVKLRFSELSQELSELALRVLGRSATGGVRHAGTDGAEAARAYLWSLQYTIAAGTSQIQRNLIAERILGMPRSA
ncbi:MAG: acyl-CoA dehydrogenase family protein, partial [Frankia sp.]